MRRVVSAGLLVASVLAVPRVGSAFVRTQTSPGSGIYLFWGQRTNIPWALSKPADSDYVADGLSFGEALGAIEASYATWADVTCTSVTFQYQGSTARQDVGYVPGATDNIDLLVFRSAGLCTDPTVVPADDPCNSSENPLECANVYNCWSHDTDIYALTTTTYNTATGQLADADTEYNATTSLHRFTVTQAGLPPCADPLDFSATGCIDVDMQNTATHEAGHFVGLAHTPISAATMYATAALGETSKRVLNQDDVNGFCNIYPPQTSSGSSSESGPGCAGVSGTMLAAFVAVLVLLRRRRSA